MVYRYASNQKEVETKSRKFRKLRNRFKPDEVVATEPSPSYHHATSVNKENFVKYLEARANVSEGLNNYYGNEDIPPEVGAADRLPFRKIKLSSIINMKQFEQRLTKKLRQKFGQDSRVNRTVNLKKGYNLTSQNPFGPVRASSTSPMEVSETRPKRRLKPTVPKTRHSKKSRLCLVKQNCETNLVYFLCTVLGGQINVPSANTLIRLLKMAGDILYSSTAKSAEKYPNAIIKHGCISCNATFDSKEDYANHISNEHIIREESINQKINAYATDEDIEDDNIGLDTIATDLDNGDLTPEDFISERNEALPIIKPNLKLDMPSATQIIDKPTKKPRTYNEAISHACQQKGTENDKNKTIFVVDTLSLKPFTILDSHGKEENALAHDTVVNKLVTEHDYIKSIPTTKRPYEGDNATDSLCINCSSQVHAELSNLFDTSPYSSLLKQREYTPLTDDICTLLNKDWQFYPQVKYFSATVFAGSIILNTNNNQAIMINTVEMYGRTKTIDFHRESFGKLKNSVITNSLPPPIKTFHQNVWPTSLDVRDGKKLVIGTQVSNALVTSSIRLDEKGLVSVGATSSHFLLNTIKDSLASKIFIDLNSLKSAKVLIEDPSTTQVSDIGIIFHQLRQVRTKFHLPSTYSLCRASGPITINHTCHPFSLFTLGEFDRGRSPSASIFNTIANEVLSNNSDAKLAKENVSRWINESKGKRKAILSNILDLYESNKDRLPILYNAPLNKELEALAILLIPTIVEANKSVEVQVKQVFEVFGCL
ncbi:hypothetical protein MFLAVUS_010413 [Mucor flavus]|uniref:C2H2-type domain-containing protein n=1 Tax=Mucor flavus TaxID=439312 RepID=A0ABP9ZCX1_9FUNG